MVYQKINSTQYRADFEKKFSNFGDKAPIMLSYALDELGVTVIHENSKKAYFFEWDYAIDVKSFIHNIKEELSYNHYPRISREEQIVEKLSAEEQADMMSKGVPSEEVPSSKVKTVTKMYRIDKVLAMKDEFVLVDEDTLEQFNYKMRGSSIYFLRNYRNGDYKTPKEAGDVFFGKSYLITKLDK